jgi:hypothetical protein
MSPHAPTALSTKPSAGGSTQEETGCARHNGISSAQPAAPSPSSSRLARPSALREPARVPLRRRRASTSASLSRRRQQGQRRRLVRAGEGDADRDRPTLQARWSETEPLRRAPVVVASRRHVRDPRRMDRRLRRRGRANRVHQPRGELLWSALTLMTRTGATLELNPPCRRSRASARPRTCSSRRASTSCWRPATRSGSPTAAGSKVVWRDDRSFVRWSVRPVR